MTDGDNDDADDDADGGGDDDNDDEHAGDQYIRSHSFSQKSNSFEV